MAEGCPVKKQQPSAAAVSEGRGKDRTYYEYWTSWMSSSPPPSSPLSPSASNSASCPSQLHTPSSTSGMSGKVGSGYNPLTNDMMFGQEKQPSQTVDLSTRRAVSSIPRGDFTPAHQLASVDQWVYPSEQQYFNAMKRKGYDPDAQDVPVILAIHNLVNEQGWAKIKQWEALRKPEATPKLLRFTGRPKDISPKAFLRSLVGYQLPFDRHDWVVEREDGQQVRYVIDFYEGRGSDRPLPSKEGESSSSPVSIYLDVRPALDSVPSVLDRLYVSLLPSALSSPTPLPKKNNTAMMTQQTDDGAKK